MLAVLSIQSTELFAATTTSNGSVAPENCTHLNAGPLTSAVLSGRERFKQHLRKVGSGEHTSKGMSRDEAADAMELMLQGEATPAQIGAFLIAHRIRRPAGAARLFHNP